MNNNYKHAGKSLTPGITQELILERFSGQTVELKVIKQEITRIHLERGGWGSKAKMHHPASLALTNMGRLELAENLSHGLWRIMRQDDSSREPNHLGEETMEFDIPSIKSIGSGEGAVYVYYFPTYRLWAESQAESSWPCKIGMTEGDPNLRIHIQVGTGMPEGPEIAIIIRTDDPSKMERMIHDTLTLRRKRMKDAPGTEWFLTSPSEVEAIHAFLSPEEAT